MIPITTSTAPRACTVHIVHVPERGQPLSRGMSKGTLHILSPDGFVTFQADLTFREGKTINDLLIEMLNPLRAMPDNASESEVFDKVYALLRGTKLPLSWFMTNRLPG